MQVVSLLRIFGCICSPKKSNLNKSEVTLKPFGKPALFMQSKKYIYKTEYVKLHSNNSK